MKTVCMILKAPHAGSVKTRLARDIGPERATAIYRALVERQAREIPREWAAAVHFTPPDAGKEMEEWLGPCMSAAARFLPQCDGDLGQRLIGAIRAEFQRGAGSVFLVGGDCPGLSRDYFLEADRRLNEVDVVIGPATDGGYVLLGLKAPHVALFENVPWSTSAVLEQTLAAANRQSLSIGLLPTLEDIDDAASLERQSAFAAISE
jgi:rSAM/selenodomain-associated transferase 1